MIRMLMIVMVILLTGCSSLPPKPTPGETDWQPPKLPPEQAVQYNHGSLYQAGYATSLFEDRMAYRVGDILTIRLDEETRSSKSAGTDMSKNSSAAISDPTLFGRTVGSIFGSGYSMNNSLEGSRSFAGSGSSAQQNMLSGSITVTVLEVRPNGSLAVSGEKWIRLNQGDEYIRISGILRPEDISPENIVSSQRMANARITYSGTGFLADANEPGWLTKFLNSSWFPL
ncbi:flagellar basal body L-ring protein FlgH [Endozoicomonas ascidiicola]|uniref:flagellar basal body L-ring protein FlgH n=1 Tax=Endozoicomonas ascidiicola TaxID=1698521 RepID=UPI00082E8F56|nr:flagellar basal body L-ring protein FlgH [Endozoicomonas ascidiicola]